MIAFWDIARHNRGDACIALMMEAVRTFETSVYFTETTRRYIPETIIFILAAVRT
jgi:hypothetical protein